MSCEYEDWSVSWRRNVLERIHPLVAPTDTGKFSGPGDDEREKTWYGGEGGFA